MGAGFSRGRRRVSGAILGDDHEADRNFAAQRSGRPCRRRSHARPGRIAAAVRERRFIRTGRKCRRRFRLTGAAVERRAARHPASTARRGRGVRPRHGKRRTVLVRIERRGFAGVGRRPGAVSVGGRCNELGAAASYLGNRVQMRGTAPESQQDCRPRLGRWAVQLRETPNRRRRQGS